MEGPKIIFNCKVHDFHSCIHDYCPFCKLEKQTDLVKELVDAAKELCDLIDDHLKGEYTIDTFTTQPLRIALSKEP